MILTIYEHAILFVASLFQGMSWFGGAILMTAIFSHTHSFAELAPFLACCGIAINATILLIRRRWWSYKLTLPLIWWSLLGIPIGVLLLHRIDQTSGRITLLILTVGFTLINQILVRKKYHPPRALTSLLGVCAGVFGYMFNYNWPFVALYTMAKRYTKEETMLLSSTYFLLIWLIIVGVHLYNNALTTQTLQSFVSTLPALIIWTRIGLLINKRLSPTAFQWLLRIFLIMAAGMLIR